MPSGTDVQARAIAGRASTFIATVDTPAEFAAAAVGIFTQSKFERRIPLTSGAVYTLPEGYIDLFDVGPFLILQRWSAARQCWLSVRSSGMGGYAPFYSTGSSHRLANPVNCVTHAVINSAGSGYSAANPPVVSTNVTVGNGKLTGIAKFRTIVGGAITLNIVSGGNYDYTPTLCIVGYEQCTPPFRQAQANPRLDTNGAITSFNYDGNFTSASAGSTTGYTGAGLDASKLSVVLVRHPDDTQTNDAVITVSAAGAGQVTDIEATNYGNPVGDRDVGASATITHNGGSGLAVTLGGCYYITATTIVTAGSYLDASGNPVTSSTANDSFLGLLVYGGLLDDEQARPLVSTGTGTLTAGALTNAKISGGGPYYAIRPKIACVPSGGIKTVATPAKVVPVLGRGGDYASFYVWPTKAPRPY